MVGGLDSNWAYVLSSECFTGLGESLDFAGPNQIVATKACCDLANRFAA